MEIGTLQYLKDNNCLNKEFTWQAIDIQITITAREFDLEAKYPYTIHKTSVGYYIKRFSRKNDILKKHACLSGLVCLKLTLKLTLSTKYFTVPTITHMQWRSQGGISGSWIPIA